MPRHSHFDSGGGVNLALIITPFLDVAFQLLAFFIMTYHPSHFEEHIDGNLLPPSDVGMKSKDPTKVDDLPVTDDVPLLQDVIAVQVKTVIPGGVQSINGEPRLVLIKRPEAPTATRISEKEDTWEQAKGKLKEALTKMAKEAGGDAAAFKANIKLEGDADLKHKYMMEAYDVCRLSGYQKVSFVAPPFERKKKE